MLSARILRGYSRTSPIRTYWGPPPLSGVPPRVHPTKTPSGLATMTLKDSLLLALPCLASAQNTVVSLFYFNNVGIRMNASIINNDATATTYCLNYLPIPEVVCDLEFDMMYIDAGEHITLVQNNGDPNYTTSLECSINSPQTAACRSSYVGSGGVLSDGDITTDWYSDISLSPITVTRGAVTAVKTTASQTVSETGSGGSETGSGSGPDPTGGADRMNGAAGVVLGGVAVAVAVTVPLMGVF
ncbi:hypothetical protein BJX76DRAFT_337323 [Aspergillus varians]